MFAFMWVYVCVCVCVHVCLYVSVCVCVCRVSVRLSVLVLVLCGLGQIYYFSAREEVRFVSMFMYVGRRLRRRAPGGHTWWSPTQKRRVQAMRTFVGTTFASVGTQGVARGGYRPRRVLSR